MREINDHSLHSRFITNVFQVNSKPRPIHSFSPVRIFTILREQNWNFPFRLSLSRTDHSFPLSRLTCVVSKPNQIIMLHLLMLLPVNSKSINAYVALDCRRQKNLAFLPHCFLRGLGLLSVQWPRELDCYLILWHSSIILSPPFFSGQCSIIGKKNGRKTSLFHTGNFTIKPFSIRGTRTNDQAQLIFDCFSGYLNLLVDMQMIKANWGTDERLRNEIKQN